MKLLELPADIINVLPHHFDSVYDLYNVLLTCRTLYNAYSNVDVRLAPILPRPDGQLLFQPHPHLLLTGVARQVGDWAVSSPSNRCELYQVLLSGYDGLLSLAERVTRVSLSDLRRLHDTKYTLLNPLTRLVDFEAGPAMVRNQDIDPDEYGLTICQCPDFAVMNYIIYCELFHHYIDDILASSEESPSQATGSRQAEGLDCKEKKSGNTGQDSFVAGEMTPISRPLEIGIRRRFIAYCVPDLNNRRNVQHKFLCNSRSRKDGQQCLDYMQMSRSSAIEERDAILVEYWENGMLGDVAEDDYYEALNRRGYPSHKKKNLFLMVVGHLGWLSLQMLLLDGVTGIEVQAKLANIKSKIKAIPEELVDKWDVGPGEDAVVSPESQRYIRSWSHWLGLLHDCVEGINTRMNSEE